MQVDETSAAVVTPAESELDRAAAYVVRGAVFVAEQGVPSALEPDEKDPGADHILARVGGAPVGTVRLVTDGGTGILGRLAVLPHARGTGLGVDLVRALERRAAERGLHSVELHSQVHARGFYARLGYAEVGEEFMEAGMAHVTMRKSLGG